MLKVANTDAFPMNNRETDVWELCNTLLASSENNCSKTLFCCTCQTKQRSELMKSADI